MGLPAGTRYALLEGPVAAAGDRIAIAKYGEEMLVETTEDVPRLLAFRDRHQRRKLPCAGLIALIRKRRVVGLSLRVVQLAHRALTDQPADRKSRHILAERQPDLEAKRNPSATGRQSGFAGNYGSEALRKTAQPAAPRWGRPSPDRTA